MEDGRRRSGYLAEIKEAASECRTRKRRGPDALGAGSRAGEAEQRTHRPPRPQHRHRRRRRSPRVRSSGAGGGETDQWAELRT
jgi:hypothetical protein